MVVTAARAQRVRGRIRARNYIITTFIAEQTSCFFALIYLQNHDYERFSLASI